MRMQRFLVGMVVASVVLAACGGEDDDTSAPPAESSTTTTTEPAAPELRLNEVQMLGSHNSYHLRPAPEVLAGIGALAGEQVAAELDYEHRPLTEQLDEFGIRQFEIDVYADPDGGRFADRPALALVELPTASGEAELDPPGFKVIHQVDVDFESTCLTLVSCLGEIEAWSSANGEHGPIMIMIEAKEESLASATEGELDLSELGVTLTEVVPMDAALFDDLEAEILSVFDREQIITPDDVRGDAETLEAAVLAGDAWPTLDDAQGKVLFSLVNTGDTRDVYVGDAPSLEGRLLFTSSEEGRADAAFLRIDDPVADGAELDRLAAAGYLIRTRTDVPGIDAPAGDTTRRDAALASGAHYLSTDYYVADPDLGTGFVVDLPGSNAARCNPVSAPPDCDL